MLKCFSVFSKETEFARPMSRRQATNRRELLSPSLMPDRHQAAVLLHPSVCLAPLVAINASSAQPPRCCTCQAVHYRGAKQPGPPIAETESSPELIAGSHLLSRLVFRRIRSRGRSGEIREQSCHSDEPTPVCDPLVRSPMASSFKASAEAPISPPALTALETLFSQLARRQLRGRAAEETRS